MYNLEKPKLEDVNMDIRAEYINFFQKKGHKIYHSMPLVPDDASLLFTNAGMVQFKDIFTGKIPTPTPPRATSSQLCIRAGGKHNDLENVGYTARHHTLFEMLGNFSFGDYFKKEAIAHAWEFVTQILGFDKNVLYVTIHESDDEAYQLWCEHIEPSRIQRMGDKDNFWQMGDSGPCGPCSEIYVDQGAEFFNGSEDYFGGEGDRFLEIWNLVFMQFEQKDGIRTPLPKPSIDTGMGLERVVALKEGKINNFDTSLFAPLILCVEKLTGIRYYHDDELLRMQNDSSLDSKTLVQIKKTNASFRVIADHARSVAFLLAQGVNFDKDGRGYVLRRILRRAVRHGYLLGLRKVFLYEVVGAVCESMGVHYDYLLERKTAVQEQCRAEEARFFETIEMGMGLFNAELAKLGFSDEASALKSCIDSKAVQFSGAVAFKLYDTFGFPLDLTQDMLREYDIELDMVAFESCMQEQKSRGKASWKGSGDALKNGDFNVLLSEFGTNAFVGYETSCANARVLAVLDSDFRRIECLERGHEGWVMLDSTPFYPESGGPVGDRGTLFSGSQEVLESNQDSKISSNSSLNPAAPKLWIDSKNHMESQREMAKVLDTQKFFTLNLSHIKALYDVQVGDSITASVDSKVRAEIIKHHSATHLLHYALRKILGIHITQAGSLVEENRLRFDFTHPEALSSEKLEHIEAFVNVQIQNASVQICENLSLEDARIKGAMALFGEKYGAKVRVISFGDSIELCGGIHVQNTAEIGSFYIVKESGVSSGVRRIEAVCGRAAYHYGRNALDSIKEAKEALKAQELMQGIERLKAQLAEVKERMNKVRHNVKSLDSELVNGTKLVVLKLDNTESNEAKEIVDNAKNEEERIAILLITESNGKIAITAGIKGTGGLKAGAWVRTVAQAMGGNGGGRDDFATAGVKSVVDSKQVQQALDLAKKMAVEAVVQG